MLWNLNRLKSYWFDQVFFIILNISSEFLNFFHIWNEIILKQENIHLNNKKNNVFLTFSLFVSLYTVCPQFYKLISYYAYLNLRIFIAEHRIFCLNALENNYKRELIKSREL